MVAWQESTGETSAISSLNLEWQRLTARKTFATVKRMELQSAFAAVHHRCMNKLHKAPTQKAGGGPALLWLKAKGQGPGVPETCMSPHRSAIWTSGLAVPSANIRTCKDTSSHWECSQVRPSFQGSQAASSLNKSYKMTSARPTSYTLKGKF